jgi:predicted RNA binding protein YcfA (HicA-like mRNA interferase family)
MKTVRELRALLRECGFQVRRQRGAEEVWEHPNQPAMQVTLNVVDIHTAHQVKAGKPRGGLRSYRRGMMVYS